GNDIALNQLIPSENHPGGELIQAARVMQNIAAIFIRKLRADFERREIEKVDIRKSPGLIFASRPRNRFEFFPSGGLLFPKPIGQLARLNRTRKNSFRA